MHRGTAKIIYITPARPSRAAGNNPNKLRDFKTGRWSTIRSVGVSGTVIPVGTSICLLIIIGGRTRKNFLRDPRSMPLNYGHFTDQKRWRRKETGEKKRNYGYASDKIPRCTTWNYLRRTAPRRLAVQSWSGREEKMSRCCLPAFFNRSGVVVVKKTRDSVSYDIANLTFLRFYPMILATGKEISSSLPLLSVSAR